MKQHILTVLFLLTINQLKAQESFSGVASIFGKTSYELIKEQNFFVNDPIFPARLYDVTAEKTGGYKISYLHKVSGTGAESLHVYYFDKDNRCYAFETLGKFDNKDDQLQYLKENGFIYVSDDTLYHKNLNLKVQFLSSQKQDVSSFTYTGKQTAFPK